MSTETAPERWRVSLWVQVVGFLTLALVPLGIMGLLQTSSLREEAEQRGQLRLLALTQAAAGREQELLLSGLGAAQTLGSILYDLSEDVGQCRAILGEFIEGNPRYSFAGYIELSGLMACSTSPNVFDYSERDFFLSQMAEPRQRLRVLPNPDVSKEPVLNFLHPVEKGGILRGFVTISVPAAGFSSTTGGGGSGQRPDSLILFNAEGDILTSQVYGAAAAAGAAPFTPEGISLSTYAGRGAGTFKARASDGQRRAFAVLPVVPEVAYAMASWQRTDALISGGPAQLPAVVFPLVMWLASIGVVSLAVHRLVLRHILRLRRRMHHFARDRSLAEPRPDVTIAAELSELEQSFESLARTVMQDEAEMEDALREKNILLKEVHHRVKNNLQMISSIMNMNLRKAQTEETRAAISRLQARVLNLAAVHRQLYVADNLAKADAGKLMHSVVGPLTHVLASENHNVEVTLDFDEIALLPDQLVPLSLLAAETVSNAVRHVGAADGVRPHLHVSLRVFGDGAVVFNCTNTVGPHTGLSATEELDLGLGTQLMRAFALQLGGKIGVDQREDSYSVTCAFQAVQDADTTRVDY